MKASPKAEQKNAKINVYYYSHEDLERMADEDLNVFKLETYDISYRVSLHNATIKVKLTEAGYYTVVVITPDGKEYYVNLDE